ncbi:hypothetical protein Hanom_Chr15g01402031 [Helianthus anomalus]
MNILFEFCVSFRSPLLNRKKLAKQGDDLEAAAAAAVLINIRRIHGFRYFHFLLEIFHNILPCSPTPPPICLKYHTLGFFFLGFYVCTILKVVLNCFCVMNIYHLY